MSSLVVDVGTSSVRAALVEPDGSIRHERARPTLPASPADGLVELDASEMADAVLATAREVAALANGTVDSVGVSNQRASVVVWERSTGRPVGAGIGWQDLRTVGRCLELRGEGIRSSPNQSATKIEWLLDHHDPQRRRDLCVGTVDSWVVWILSEGALHVTDASNAAVTGLTARDATGWDDAILAALHIPVETMPTIVDSVGAIGAAPAVEAAPPITAVLGDQQASLVGQGCVERGDAKVTFGTGGMLDLVLGDRPARSGERGPAGTFPIVAWRRAGVTTWGAEAIMLAAGTNVEWLRDGLGVVRDTADSHEVAARCSDTGGVVYVPALLGLGTPHWDFGARGTFVGLTRGTGRPEVVRAVLEGIAQRGADLVEAAEADTGIEIPTLRVDGGMSDNPTFVQALADATGRVVEVSPVREATARGAGLFAALGAGHLADTRAIAATWKPRVRHEPERPPERDRWREAVRRAEGWIPDLSAIDF